MADQTLLAQARKARFDDLPNFSGHPSEDVERFLKCIKNITKANDESSNHEILEIVRGKLTQSAGLWFDNNEHTFRKWSDFEAQFRNRYASTTIIHQKFDKLKQRKQSSDESVAEYIDDVINLCREIDSSMSDAIIIQHLMSGINPDFRKEISRHESCTNSLNEFLKYAKIEQDLYDTFEKTRFLSLESQQPTFAINHTTTPQFIHVMKRSKVHQPTEQNQFPAQQSFPQSSANQRNSKYPSKLQYKNTPTKQPSINPLTSHLKNEHNNNKPRFQQRSHQSCKICGRTNHQTNNCYYRSTVKYLHYGGNHHTRNFTTLPNFQ